MIQGLNKDTPILSLQHGEMPWALNAVVNQQGDLRGISAEPGFRQDLNFGKSIIGTIIFCNLTNPAKYAGELPTTYRGKSA